MSGSLTVIAGTTTLTSIGTITLDSAGELTSGGSSNAIITGSVQVYLPGGHGTDSGSGPPVNPSSTIPYYNTASQTGSTINIVWFENNPAQGTAHEYLTAARAATDPFPGTVNVDAIVAAALAYSSANGVAIYFPAGTYTLQSAKTLLTGTALIGAPGFQTVFAKANGLTGGPASLFKVTGNNSCANTCGKWNNTIL